MAFATTVKPLETSPDEEGIKTRTSPDRYDGIRPWRQALMKKGLRLDLLLDPVPHQPLETSPDEEGIKTLTARRAIHLIVSSVWLSQLENPDGT